MSASDNELRAVKPRAIRSAASDRLAAIQPRVELRLTAPLQLRTNHLHPSLIESRGGEEPRAQARLPWRGVVSRAEGR
jgi:hypothetical protein